MARIIIVLIKILAILSIIGIVISIISIFILAVNFMTVTIAQAIATKHTNTRVKYTTPFIILLISVTILACIIVL